jgi:hypothetical protein
MTGKLCVALMLATVGASGCAPLAQAPLVYSSRQQMGVGVSAGTPDTPGLDMAIGYKGLDAAYIPVAVGRACQLQSNAATARQDRVTPVCSENDLRLWLVQGTNRVFGERRTDQDTIRNLRIEMTDLNKSIGDSVEKIKLINQALQLYDEVERLQQPVTAADGTVTPVDTVRVADLRGQIAKLVPANLSTRDKLVTERSALETANALAKALYDKKDDELNRLANARSNKNSDDKVDALSVYGSFEGNASASSSSAGLSLGKVFSTGVAAQHITQGLHESAPILAGAACLQRLTDLITAAKTDADKSALAQKGVVICSTSKHDADE